MKCRFLPGLVAVAAEGDPGVGGRSVCGGRTLGIDAGQLNRELVLQNDALVGSVNANLRHYRLAAEALARADVDWLQQLITTRIPLKDAAEAFNRPAGQDVKVVISLDDDTA